MATESIKYWRATDFGGMEALRASYRSHSFARHAHDEFVIAVVEQGTAVFNLGGQVHHAPAGSVTLINPGESHTGRSIGTDGWTFRALYPQGELLMRSLRGIVGGAARFLEFKETVVPGDTQTAALLRNLHLCLEEPHSALHRESRFLDLAAVLVTRYGNTDLPLPRVGREKQAIQRVRELLNAHSSSNISLEALSLAVNLSPFHLVRAFTRAFGISPHAYQSQQRVQLAKRLLSKGSLLAQAATEAGYCDQSHMTRDFKRRLGITPGQYLDSARTSNTVLASH